MPTITDPPVIPGTPRTPGNDEASAIVFEAIKTAMYRQGWADAQAALGLTEHAAAGSLAILRAARR